MSTADRYGLTGQQLRTLGRILKRGAHEASTALQKWLQRSSVLTVEAVEQLDLREATSILDANETPICFCSTEVTGRLTGALILAFEDASGLALADMLLHQPRGTASHWDDLVTSAALETTNIVGCAYLNAMGRALPAVPGESSELLPSPPRFRRDFAESLLQFALMPQAVTTNRVFLARSRFQIDEEPVRWTLLFIPDTTSVRKLARLLQENGISASGQPFEGG
jgi:chemotaxis protein CheC